MKLKKLRPSDCPLQCEVEGQHLVIRTGIGTLAWASLKTNHGPLSAGVSILDKRQWAKDIRREFLHEEEDGSTPISCLLDDMIEKAAESGSGALQYPKRQKP